MLEEFARETSAAESWSPSTRRTLSIGSRAQLAGDAVENPGPEPLIVEDGPTACIESSPGACDVTKKQATACTYSACRPNFMWG